MVDCTALCRYTVDIAIPRLVCGPVHETETGLEINNNVCSFLVLFFNIYFFVVIVAVFKKCLFVIIINFSLFVVYVFCLIWGCLFLLWLFFCRMPQKVSLSAAKTRHKYGRVSVTFAEYR